jgi:hypothetical protein
MYMSRISYLILYFPVYDQLSECLILPISRGLLQKYAIYFLIRTTDSIWHYSLVSENDFLNLKYKFLIFRILREQIIINLFGIIRCDSGKFARFNVAFVGTSTSLAMYTCIA